ncbi:hypothetical protein QQS21_000747 [Conoideocrella luteorostrata]|uniref:Nucleoside phosphorylase domain-containing protein n=1 Tax=Conoideocrella luteorostrata TaxID=1105319 RepID=A0AAJ0G3U5_9HYPO|nr:hypothetical protein QQS21_000747 [Conoideocrella luteorostrata]
MRSLTPPRNRDGFDIALICALPLEAECVQAVFDKFWEDEGKRYGKANNDPNAYTTGVIGRHNAVLAYMPGMGTTSAAASVASMKVSFPNIKLALVVGICGGVPFVGDQRQEEIILGDVIVSQALIQYDFGRLYAEGFEKKTSVLDTLGRAGPEIRSFQAKLSTDRYQQKTQGSLRDFLRDIESQLPDTKRPGKEFDVLYGSSHIHRHHVPTCKECVQGKQICEVARKSECEDLGCDSDKPVARKRLSGESVDKPKVHFGIMGSANTVLKSAEERDRLAKADGIIAFEMEGAGVWDQFPSIVIKGVCDYADSHKSKRWQHYAAAAAAATAKAFLLEWNSPDNPARSNPRLTIGLPYSGSTYFSGRTNEISEMRRIMSSQGSLHRVLLWGVAGSGKTELAIQYALQNEEDFSAIFFMNAKTEASVKQDILSIARTLGLPEATTSEPGKPETSVASLAVIEALKQWFAEHDGNWLLVMDNFDFQEEYDLNKYLPLFSNTKGNLIITSQNRNANAYGSPIEVAEMSEEAAQELFIRRSGSTDLSEKEKEICLEIVGQLGYLALAVEHAAAYMFATTMSLETYVKRLRENLSYYLNKSVTGSLHERTTHTTLEMTFRAVRDRNAKAVELLSFLAHLDNKALLESYLLLPLFQSRFTKWKCHENVEEFYEIKSILSSFSLIRSQKVPGHDDVTLSMHQIVHSTIRSFLDEETHRLFLARGSVFVKLNTGEALDGKWFPHLQLVLRLATQRFGEQLDKGDFTSEALWNNLVVGVFRYRFFWQCTGTMHELHALCATMLKVMHPYTKTGELRWQRLVLVAVSVAATQFLQGPDAVYPMTLKFLIENMTPLAARFIEECQDPNLDKPNLNFRPCTISDVFKVAQSPPVIINIFVDMLQSVAIMEYSQPERRKLGAVYLRLSQLPKQDSWITRARRFVGMGPWLDTEQVDITKGDLAACAMLASRDRETGNMDSTIVLLENIIKSSVSFQASGFGGFEAAIFDLTKLFLKMNRLEDAKALVAKLDHPNDESTELSIALRHKDYYVWTRKTEVMVMTAHEEYESAENMLLETYETTRKAFGESSLSSIHAAFLLEQFYLRDWRPSPTEAEKFRKIYADGLAGMYCSRLRMRLGEGLFMGKILMSQGALEEAAMVFKHFALGAEKLWGPEDSMTKRAKRWEVHAAAERSVELRDEKEGRATLGWGCGSFPRTISSLGVDDN